MSMLRALYFSGSIMVGAVLGLAIAFGLGVMVMSALDLVSHPHAYIAYGPLGLRWWTPFAAFAFTFLMIAFAWLAVDKTIRLEDWMRKRSTQGCGSDAEAAGEEVS